MSGDSRQPPTPGRRARLAARGILPYEPAAVYAAALCGILLLLASSGEGWFEEWKMLLRQAAEQPHELAALAASSWHLLLRSVGSLVGVSLLCGGGVGWMQRRLSPPAASRSEGPLPGSETAAPAWFAAPSPGAPVTTRLLLAASTTASTSASAAKTCRSCTTP